MKTLHVMLFLILSTSLLFSQERALAKIHYKFSHINDTTKRDQPQKDEVVLNLGKNSALYKSYSDELVRESIAAQKAIADYTGHLVIDMSFTPIKQFYLHNSQENKLEEIESISSSFDAYVTEIPLESQDWQIQEDTLNIGGYMCQNATCTFKGRNYIAWFTSEIPFQEGPWKLYGLPGLILSAYDEAKEVVFEYAGFDFIPSSEEVIIEIPSYVQRATKSEIKRVRDVFVSDQSKYYQILNSAGKMDITTSFYGIDYSNNTIDLKSDDDYKPSFSSNNPIEKIK